MFIIADGAKNMTDEVLVNQTREIVAKIDWNCDVRTNFSDINLGCSIRIISGLNWVFEYVDRTIILEDDCLPNTSFFQFCEELLNHYQDDEQVMHISGFNVFGKSKIEDSYFFSKFILPPWGWATWKRAWNQFNPELDTWQHIKTWAFQNITQDYFKDWTDMFEYIRINKTTWDVPWNMDIWKKNGLVIIPQISLVQNIGFGEQATFTKNNNINLIKIESYEMKFPLNHPQNKCIEFDIEIEKEIIDSLRANLS